MGTLAQKDSKNMKKHPKNKKCVFENALVFFSQAQISTFFKIMLKMKLFVENRIEKTSSKQNELMLESICLESKQNEYIP